MKERSEGDAVGASSELAGVGGEAGWVWASSGVGDGEGRDRGLIAGFLEELSGIIIISPLIWSHACGIRGNTKLVIVAAYLQHGC